MERITLKNSMRQMVFKRPVLCDRCGEEMYDVYPDFDGVTVAEKLGAYEELGYTPNEIIALIQNGQSALDTNKRLSEKLNKAIKDINLLKNCDICKYASRNKKECRSETLCRSGKNFKWRGLEDKKCD